MIETRGFEEGVCPNCKSDDVDYGTSELMGMSLMYEITCNNCGAKGEEWYGIEYHETRVEWSEAPTKT